MRIRPVLVLLSLAAVAPALDFKAVDAYVSQITAKRGVPGLSLAVVKNGKVVYAKGYGMADLENRVPATPDTVYEIGSVTKQFTSAIVMQLVQEGKVKLDESAATYLPSLPEAWKGVTVRHLLTHTSGIKSYTETPNFEKRMREPMAADELLALIGPIKPDFAPGADWKYNNSGYYLLGMLIEKITGKSYRANLQERICRPLEMRSTDVNDPRAIVPHRAKGYEPASGGPKNAMYIDMGWPGAAGAIISSASDMAKWDAAMYGDRILEQKSWTEAWTPVKLAGGKPYPYGFGWVVGQINGIGIVEHGGDIPGFNADILRIPSKKLTVIVLCNIDPGVAGIAAKAIAGIVDPSLKVSSAGVKDDEPAITATHRELLEKLMAGTLPKEPFTPEMQARLFPNVVVTARSFLNRFGSKLDAFKLVKTDSQEGAAIRVYLATIGGQGLQVMFATMKDGKIGGFSITPG